ncbi:uncharacterized protein AKAME5_001510700 [Lates japonicus]|uniref:C2H2-type domain-containing protein n=1 Tax=Lates japonicus TaxID=270547 RepID=A0AAD3N0Z1_LATJO|nr:uncharacterized protein AKAME5_001510700 [Lates japonicus]
MDAETEELKEEGLKRGESQKSCENAEFGDHASSDESDCGEPVHYRAGLAGPDPPDELKTERVQPQPGQELDGSYLPLYFSVLYEDRVRVGFVRERRGDVWADKSAQKHMNKCIWAAKWQETMQSPTQANTGPDSVTAAPTEQPLDTGTEAQPAHSEPDVLEERTESAALAETETIITPQENQAAVQTEEAPATVAGVTQAVEKETAVQPLSEPSETSAGKEIVSASKPSAPTGSGTNTAPRRDGQKAKKQDKHDGRKYVPSKKAMIDPLKMDMSKPLVMPLTSSQLSLQCIECHIIFSDHKSKERHLKSSHPAEYEQCILRNALFACYVCDRYFTNSTELMVHQKAHVEKKPFKCPICGLAFNKSSELTLHKKIHFGQDGYTCTDCGKSCKTLTLLKYHRRTHTGERPYVCKECGKRFTMSKALQKHILSHLPEGTEEDEGDTTAKAQLKKNDALLQVEPNGPLQKVDANIDTEQIRKLIESLGNVQKVNQVVILGQVPPHAPPLEVQQIPQLAEPVNLNLSPPQIDFIGLKQSESKTVELGASNNQCDSMEQTIILEPITPDGQLENPPFSELGSHIATGENIELTLVQAEQVERPEGGVMHEILQQPEISAIQSDSVDQMVCQNEVADLKENLEQTVILELTPALISTLELEQSQTVPQNENPSSSLVPTTELEKSPAQTVTDEQETGLSVPSLMPTVELELTPLQTEQQDLPSCPFVPPDTLTETPNESETNSKEELNSQMQTVSLDQVHHEMDGAAPQEMQEKAEKEPSKKLLIDSKEDGEQLEKLPEVEDTSAKEEAPSQLETKQVSHQLPETSPTKPKTTRKRKASNVETEGVITSSHSKRALECKDCGERFSEVSSLQKHKTMVHIVESPGLTYTNGNIFEGVSRSDLYHLPKQRDKVVGVMNAAADWDTEPEMGEMPLEDRERTVSFPALIPSPSLPIPPLDVETKSLETGRPLASDEAEQDPKHPSSESEVQATKDEDIKEDLLLERETADKDLCLMTMRSNKRQGLDSITENEAQEIKVEENISDPPLNAHTCQNRQSASVQPQHHRDIRSVLVKEESSLMLNEAQASQGRSHIRWNVEPVNNENTATPLMESEETTRDCCITPEFNTNQCIFYPVKEEEREVLLGATHTSRGSLSPEGSSATHQLDCQTADHTLHEGNHATQDYQEVGVRGLLSAPGVSGFADGQDAEWPHPPDLRDFLLQSSNEENEGSELSDPQLDSEAEVMAYFYKNQTNGTQQLDHTPLNLPSSTTQFQVPREENRTREPIDYFSRYFCWDTWVEIASCTNELSSTPNRITAREVAQFVGIHIAMGTLKFPSPRLYWEDLTKVPLIAEAMPLSRFLELSCKLKLASPAKDPVNSDDSQNEQHSKTLPSRQCVISDKEDAVEKMVPKGSMVFLCKQELSTPAMLERLLVAGVHGAGRVGGARGQIGDEFVSSDGKLMLRRSHCGFILSTAGNGQRNMASLTDNFERAQMSAHLNRDLRNLYVIPLTASSPTCWPQAVLWYLTDLALINSWLLYRQDHGAASAPLTLMAFRLEVSKALIFSSGSDTQDSVPPQPPTEKAHTANETPNPSVVEESPLPDAATRYDGSGHWPEQLGEGEGGSQTTFKERLESRKIVVSAC